MVGIGWFWQVVNQFTLIIFRLVASQDFSVYEISIEVASAFATVSFYSWIIDWFDKFAIIDHQFCKSYKTSIIVSCIEDTKIVCFDWCRQFTLDVTISWHLRIMCPTICQWIIVCTIGYTISHCHNIRPSFTVLADLDFTITKIVLSSVLDVSSDLLDSAFATKFQGYMAIFMGIVWKLNEVVVDTIKQLIEVINLTNIITSVCWMNAHSCRF